jgi:O-antigen/teichoic acid export membrane protein
LDYFANKLTATFPIVAPYIKRFQGEGVGATLARGAGGAFIVQVIGTGLMFAVHVVLARTMGASSYGNFVYAVTWLNILALFGKLGLDTASLRFVAEYNGTRKWGFMKGFSQRSSQISLLASFIVGGSTAAVIWFVRDRLDPELAAALWVVCLIMPLNSLLLLKSSGLRGLKKVVKAQSAVLIVRPVALICLVGCVYLFSKEILDATTAMAMNLAAFAGALIFVTFYFNKAFPKEAADAKPEHMTGMWARVALPMLFISLIMRNQNQMDVIVIGFMLDSSQVGIYAAAKKITMLITFGLTAVNMMAAPMIAELWHQGRKKELQRMLKLAAWGILAFTLPVSLGMILFGKYLLSLFGPEFTAAYWALVILACGRIFSSLAGSVGLVLNMTGHQNFVFTVVAISFVVNILLCLLLIPALSFIGAAIAMSTTLVLWNAVMFIYIVRKLNLSPAIISFNME